MAPKTPNSDTVASVLEGYADRGVFRAFSREPGSGRRTTFRMIWHYGRLYEVVFDEAAGTFRIPQLLPDVAQKSKMYRELKAFLRSRRAAELPEHRRVDPARAVLRPYNSAGRVSLSLRALDGDLEYATRKLVQVVHEIFVAFLRDGPYYEYLVETFDLEPDSM